MFFSSPFFPFFFSFRRRSKPVLWPRRQARGLGVPRGSELPWRFFRYSGVYRPRRLTERHPPLFNRHLLFPLERGNTGTEHLIGARERGALHCGIDAWPFAWRAARCCRLFSPLPAGRDQFADPRFSPPLNGSTLVAFALNSQASSGRDRSKSTWAASSARLQPCGILST